MGQCCSSRWAREQLSAAALIILPGGFPGLGVLRVQHKAWHELGALQMFVEWSVDGYLFHMFMQLALNLRAEMFCSK